MRALALAASVLVGVVAAPIQATADDACSDNVGITIVVDFQDLGGGVNLACAPGAVSSGLDALNKAGVSWEGTKRFPGVVCRIAGRPGPDADPCVNTPPANAYWGYWIAPRGGQWCYSKVGAGNRTPPPGSVEGWSFAVDHGDGNVPPPRYAPPPPIPGTTPNQLDGSDCTPPSSSPPSTAPPSAPPVTEKPIVVGASATTTTLAAARGSSSSTTPDASSTTSFADAAPTTPTTATPSSGVALNSVDLHDDGRGGAGSPVGVFVTIGVLAAAGVGAVAFRRRRGA